MRAMCERNLPSVHAQSESKTKSAHAKCGGGWWGRSRRATLIVVARSRPLGEGRLNKVTYKRQAEAGGQEAEFHDDAHMRSLLWHFILHACAQRAQVLAYMFCKIRRIVVPR